MTARTLPPSETCPDWCAGDERMDKRSDPLCHPDDFVTWHRSAISPFHTSLNTNLELQIEKYDPDVPDAEARGPIIDISGDDGSGNICGLALKVEDARRLAHRLLRLCTAIDGIDTTTQEQTT